MIASGFSEPGSTAILESRSTSRSSRISCGSSANGLSRRPDVDRQARILAVDDTPQNIKLLEAVLAPRGYRVVPAASGREALDKVAEERPDLVLLDVVMPGL